MLKSKLSMSSAPGKRKLINCDLNKKREPETKPDLCRAPVSGKVARLELTGLWTRLDDIPFKMESSITRFVRNCK